VKGLVEVLEDIGVNTQNIRVTSDFNEFREWLRDYIIEWYDKEDELISTIIQKTALDSKMFALFHIDDRIDVYLATRDEGVIYSLVGSIIQNKLGVKLSGSFIIEAENCNDDVVEGLQMVSLVLNSVLTNLVEEALSYALVSKIASNKYHKYIRKSMKKLKKNLQKAVDEGLIPESYGKWGIWIIDSVFFEKDSEISDLLEKVSIRRDKSSLLEFLKVLIGRGKDFDVKIDIRTIEKKGKIVYLLESRGVIRC
jgi:hypothetical protein